MPTIIKQWIEVSRELPPEGAVVLTKIDEGRRCRNEQLLRRGGRLWFFVDHSMYVYYTPTHWLKEIEEG